MSKYHHVYQLKQQDPTITDGPTELHIELGNPELPRDADGKPIRTSEALIAGIDRSIVNGLRRILLSEVRTRGFGMNVLVPETFLDTDDMIQRGNLTIFNSEHLSNRIGMVPIHDYVIPLTTILGATEDAESNQNTGYVTPPSLLSDEQNWIFRICDSNDPNLPLKHNDDGDVYNRQRFVKVKDIRVFHRNVSTENAENPEDTDNPFSTPTTGPVTPAGTNVGTTTSSTTISHSKDKMAQVSSKINYIFPGKGEWTEMDMDFKKKIFKYPELILLSLKKGEGVFAEMQVETGYGGVINPNAMLPPANSHARWISAIPDYRFKMTKEFAGTYNKTTKQFTSTYDPKIQIANALKNFELDRQLAPILSRLNLNTIILKKVQEYQTNIDQSEFFPDPVELAAQKNKLDLKVKLLNQEISEDKAASQELEKQKKPAYESHDPVLDQKDYMLSYDPILSRYGNPERYVMVITYNGHLWPQDVWVYAIQTMIEKVRKFKIILNSIQDVSGRVTDRALVKFDHNIPERIEITIDDKIDIESHTLGNLIKCHYIYLLDHIIEKLYPNQYIEAWTYCFSNYKVPHPLKTELIMTFQTPGEDFPLFPDTGRYTKFVESQEVASDIDSDQDSDEDRDDKLEPPKKSMAKPVTSGSSGTQSKGLFSHMYDRDTNETLRLLKITCDVLLDKFQDMLNDAKTNATNAKW